MTFFDNFFSKNHKTKIRIINYGQVDCTSFSHYTFTGKERDSETGYGYFGARYMDHELMTMWLSVDPMADKYPGISPYAYCAWNPVKLVDPDGMEIIIPGKTSISYSIGMSTNGLSGFQKRVVKSLNKIGQTSIGKELLTDLCDSKNKFYIKKGSNGFEHDDSQKAYKNQYTSDPDLKSKYDAIKARKEDAFEGGSGGTIFWTGKGEILPTTKGGQRNKITDLAHELFHAMDANHGRLDDRLVDGVSISDWQAVYNENILRGQMRAPLRTHYVVGVHEDGRYSCGLGPSMINSDGKPVKPSWR